MIANESKTFDKILPTTKEGWEVLIREGIARNKNYLNCESEIEEDFLHSFYKVKSDNVSINGQENCQTRLGQFRLDFVITEGQQKIGFECDGKKFHDKNRDQLRDEAILKTGFVNTIYRVPGKSIWFHTYEVLDLLRVAEPFLFSNQGNRLLDRILEDDAKREDKWNSDYVVRSLSRQKLAEDGECELGEIDYNPPQYVLLGWRRQTAKKL
jgi:very-short-patch-repair endonuclease